MIGHQSGSCALCQLQDHVIRVLGTSGGSVRPAPIIQHLKSEHLIELLNVEVIKEYAWNVTDNV